MWKKDCQKAQTVHAYQNKGPKSVPVDEPIVGEYDIVFCSCHQYDWRYTNCFPCHHQRKSKTLQERSSTLEWWSIHQRERSVGGWRLRSLLHDQQTGQVSSNVGRRARTWPIIWIANEWERNVLYVSRWWGMVPSGRLRQLLQFLCACPACHRQWIDAMGARGRNQRQGILRMGSWQRSYIWTLCQYSARRVCVARGEALSWPWMHSRERKDEE